MVGDAGARPPRGQSRREFLRHTTRDLCVGAIALLLAGCAIPAAPFRQPTRRSRVAFLAAAAQPYHEGLWRGLHERGYREDQNVALVQRSAEGRVDRLPQLAAEIVRLEVDVIVAADTAAAVAARAASGGIPIVMVTSGDPVGRGLVASLARPGGNVTGISTLLPALSGKRLDLLRQLVPDAARILVLEDASDLSIATGQAAELQAAARALGTQLQPLQVQGLDDVERAFERLQGETPQGLLSLLDPLASGSPKPLVDLLANRRLPAIYPSREPVEAGGLMSYGPNLTEQFQRAANHVDKILKGAKPEQLPVERPIRFELVINRGTAESLEITMTESALLLVDEVI